MSYFELELDYIHCPARYIINLCKKPIFLIRLFQYYFLLLKEEYFQNSYALGHFMIAGNTISHWPSTISLLHLEP